MLNAKCDFCSVTLAWPTHRETRPDERGAALGGCRPTLRCLLLDAGLSLLLCRKGIRATTQAPPLTHSVPYDSERCAAKRHRQTTGLPILATDDTEINFF